MKDEERHEHEKDRTHRDAIDDHRTEEVLRKRCGRQPDIAAAVVVVEAKYFGSNFQIYTHDDRDR